jgi:hypothetical protein
MELIQFDLDTKGHRRLLREFVRFHWKHYEDDDRYIPLLDMEYFGSRLMGVTGFFTKRNLFLRHANLRFFMVRDQKQVLARCCAYVDKNFINRWKVRAGFFGFFEVVEDINVARMLLDGASQWLRDSAMELIRGPQHLPVNEATPGVMVEGFDTPPVIYYHYNKPYYARMLEELGFKPIKRFVSYGLDAALLRRLLQDGSGGSELPEKAQTIKKKLDRVRRIVSRMSQRGGIRVEPLDKKRFSQQAEIVWRIYNEAWYDNWGFVPWEKEEFCHILEEEKMILDPNLFLIAYVGDEPAAFFGVVPNVNEVMRPIPGFRWCDLMRAAKMFLLKDRVHSVRVGYFGILPRYRKKGLDAFIFWMAIQYWLEHLPRITRADVGYILEDNELVIRPVVDLGGWKEKTFIMYERPL